MSSTDLVMAEAPAQTTEPRNFKSSSISNADLQTINELASYLAENSYDYASHVQLISLLHHGFVAQQVPTGDQAVLPKPSDYSLLSDLRQAREAMNSRFAVGEDVWVAWIQDESLLAKTSEDRSNVMELCMKAVQEEPLSIALWKLYGEWVWSTYAIANGFADADSDNWSEEDMMICKEVFTRELILSVWEQAVNATKWRIDESNVIWDRYVELIMQDFPENPSTKTIEEVRTLYMMRLEVPHAAWEATSQAFWPFISKYDPEGWEEIMSTTNELAAPAKRYYALREEHELAVRRAIESQDTTLLYEVFSNYLAYEKKQEGKKKAPFAQELLAALYDRALLRLPTMVDWWLDYTDYLIRINPSNPAILPVLERASRHCPWSGELWSRRMLQVELEVNAYDEVESIKHKATNSGLLQVGGMEQLLIVYGAWCGFLRRRAFAPQSTDDDVDMADMGISGVLEDVQVAGKKTYGEDFKGDPSWRIEKMFIKFLTQARRWDDVRNYYKGLIDTHASSSEFWVRYYHWEMFAWSPEYIKQDIHIDTPERVPHLASDVLWTALERKDLDWPERVFETAEHHFEMHGLPEEVQKARVELRFRKKQLDQRRVREAAEAVETAAAHEPVSAAINAESTETGVSKRKRDGDVELENTNEAKRNKVEEQVAVKVDSGIGEASSSAAAQIKRDREHNTITVKNLPADYTEKRLRQFFMDVSTQRSPCKDYC